ncbi:hypothetical protein KR054_010990, partial [Drosophila jambulina]
SKLPAVLNPLQGASTTTEANVNIPSGFEKIGTRYYKIVNEKEEWDTAERRCREMGGYLASFRNEEDFNSVAEKVRYWTVYWLGLNHREIKGRFVSVASHKPAQFLKWGEGHPNNRINNKDCVSFLYGEMYNYFCYSKQYFICQADTE